MVIGNGLLAQRFASYAQDAQVVIFASGVSDSKTTDEAAFDRERQLLQNTRQQYPEALLVYFSTCSVHDPGLQQQPYVLHKLALEQWLEQHVPYLIFRISNVAGHGGNRKTIFHFLAQAIQQQQPFTLWAKATRNLIDADDVYRLVQQSISTGIRNRTIQIANPHSYTMPELVMAMEKHFGKKADYAALPAGASFDIDTSEMEAMAQTLGIEFGPDYLPGLLAKYYPVKP